MIEIPEWPHALGKPEATGVLRQSPEDFEVEEIPRIRPEGEGSHLWLWVEKRSANTDWVAKQLAITAKCHPRDIGYAGLKDRHAVTRQWFSVPFNEALQGALDIMAIEGVRVLEACHHSRKLKRGTLDGNRFKLRVRDFSGDAGETTQRLEHIGDVGVPNYFGPQRFGYQGQNVDKGYNLLLKGVRLRRDKKSIYLSALRSFLFNHVLAERVNTGTWASLLEGELAMLDGTRSVFSCDHADADIEDRCKRLDIHPTGPMPGDGGTQPTGDVLKLEQSVLQHWPELTGVLTDQRVQASRRALRLNVKQLQWQFCDDGLELSFTLPAGAFATTVLREILAV